MTTRESPDMTLAEQISPPRPSRPRLSRAERGSVLIAAAAPDLDEMPSAG